MGSLAQLAKASGCQVAGVDDAVYPPMSDQLANAEISYDEGYANHRIAEGIAGKPYDFIVIGNAISRGNPALEYVLDNGLNYVSAPQWIAEHVLREKYVLAVAGTHGKTTTASMLAWILEFAGLEPGFLIGGVPENFGFSAQLGAGKFFVIEADEYDSAFSDKRSKFIHYKPNTLVINNIEFDHADIFKDLNAIQTQFHHMIRVMPGTGHICFHHSDTVRQVIDRGCWSATEVLSGASGLWDIEVIKDDFSHFALHRRESPKVSSMPPEAAGEAVEVERGDIEWALLGEHNALNALSAVAAARSVGVSVTQACAALAEFKSVKRRLQLIADHASIKVFDDFAHHPTAIKLTLDGVRKKFASERRIIAVIELGSNTMQSGFHNDVLPLAVTDADRVFWFTKITDHGFTGLDGEGSQLFSNIDQMLAAMMNELRANDVVVVMSNSGFSGFQTKLLSELKQKF